MSFYVELERLAQQALAQIPDHLRLAVADAIITLMKDGIPEAAVPGEDGRWTLLAGEYILVFLEDDLDIYVIAIEPA
jgi:hypothetical protein